MRPIRNRVSKPGRGVRAVAALTTAFVAAVLSAGGAAAPAASNSAGAAGEVVITCTGCEDSKTDIFLHARYLVAEAFNRKYKGRYRIEYVPFAGSNSSAQYIPYFKRLALSNKLPDLFQVPGYVLTDLSRSGRLVNYAPYLSGDRAWRTGFYPGVFLSLTDSRGRIWGIPETRDAIGIFWNKSLFAKAGVRSFPTTWPGLLTAAEKLKAQGITPFAMDGLWVTLLWWANLIGTDTSGQGVAFLEGDILKGNLASRPYVIRATEFLKRLHTEGYVNADAFSGDFFAADNAFLKGRAATLANGPWEIKSGIRGPNADPGLYEQLGYAPAPGSGTIVVAAEGAWGSGAKDEAHRRAVFAFMKFMTSKQMALFRYGRLGGYWPRKLALTPADKEKLDPLSYGLVVASEKAKYRFPHALYRTPATFIDAWKNDWPAYVQGGMSTKDFLDRLSQAVKPQ